jgi:hypothetical protein
MSNASFPVPDRFSFSCHGCSQCAGKSKFCTPVGVLAFPKERVMLLEENNQEVITRLSKEQKEK